MAIERSVLAMPAAPRCREEPSLSEALRMARWTLRRWSLTHIWYRLRLPIRRRRWTRDNFVRTKAFAKFAIAGPTGGPALAFGEFSGRHGLGRAAAYDLELLRTRHSALTAIDIGPYLEGRAPAPLPVHLSRRRIPVRCVSWSPLSASSIRDIRARLARR